jgi:hypothetical protein
MTATVTAHDDGSALATLWFLIIQAGPSAAAAGPSRTTSGCAAPAVPPYTNTRNQEVGRGAAAHRPHLARFTAKGNVG